LVGTEASITGPALIYILEMPISKSLAARPSYSFQHYHRNQTTTHSILTFKMKPFIVILSLLAATASAAPTPSSAGVGYRSLPVQTRDFATLVVEPVQEEDIAVIDGVGSRSLPVQTRDFATLVVEPVQEEDIVAIDNY
jgi:hypothetical protein